MDYSKILKLNDDAIIVDVIGMYKALLKEAIAEIKLGKGNISKINELNFAFVLACTSKSQNELTNQKNKYILDNQVMIIMDKITKAINSFKVQENVGTGICFSKINALLGECLKDYTRLVNYLRRVKTTEEFTELTTEFDDVGWGQVFQLDFDDFLKSQLMPAIYYTKECQMFLSNLKKAPEVLELLEFLNKNIETLLKIEVANASLITIIGNNDYKSDLDYVSNLVLRSKLNEIIIKETALNHLALSELISFCTPQNVTSLKKKIVKDLNLKDNKGRNL